MARRTPHKTVGQRLSVLVLVEAIAALALVVVAFSAALRLASHARYTHRFAFVPLSHLGAGLASAAELRNEAERDDPSEREARIVGELSRLSAQYRAEWRLFGSTNPDARRLMAELRHVGELGLVEQELRAIDDLRFAVDRYIAVRRANAPESERLEAVDDIRAILYELLDMNLRLGLVSRGASEKITTETLWLTGVLGLLGIAAAIIVGVRVRNAIAPRIECLVAKVRKFQETGVIEVGPEQEGDELSVLNHALDVGFTAIEARDRERNRFMSVAAHELKTPVSNIQAFAQTALAYPQGSALRDRALEVISRQAQRIARLVEDMFLVARARSKDLPFAPAPMNIVESVEKIAAELEASNPERHFELNTSERGALFGDVELLSAALWTMLSYGLGRSSPETSVNVRISRSALQVLVTLSNFGPGFTNHELSRVFEPLVEIRYEGTKVPRNALGLYLCAEIARLHGGSMSAHNDAEGRPVLVLALPA